MVTPRSFSIAVHSPGHFEMHQARANIFSLTLVLISGCFFLFVMAEIIDLRRQAFAVEPVPAREILEQKPTTEAEEKPRVERYVAPAPIIAPYY